LIPYFRKNVHPFSFPFRKVFEAEDAPSLDDFYLYPYTYSAIFDEEAGLALLEEIIHDDSLRNRCLKSFQGAAGIAQEHIP
jgi:hypothetical protein